VDEHASIIIKKVKKGGHGGHHGGAWKVAYADFVTAMMAFFLLLWLLNATTEEQKMGISNYFDPTAISRSTRSGSGGVLGGTSITKPGALKTASSPPMLSTPQVARPQAEDTEALDPDSDDPENIESKTGSDSDEEGTISQEQLEQLL
jgi:chemotaxis protein MotB